MSKNVTVAAVCAVVLTAASPVHAAAIPTIRLDLPGTKSTYFDVGRKGYSAGDYFLTSGRLLDAKTHASAGRLGGVWTILSRQADHVVFDLALSGGTVFVTGRIAHAAPSSTLAVAGGTGRYAGMRGTVVFRYSSQTSARLDVRLRR